MYNKHTDIYYIELTDETILLLRPWLLFFFLISSFISIVFYQINYLYQYSMKFQGSQRHKSCQIRCTGFRTVFKKRNTVIYLLTVYGIPLETRGLPLPVSSEDCHYLCPARTAITCVLRGLSLPVSCEDCHYLCPARTAITCVLRGLPLPVSLRTAITCVLRGLPLPVACEDASRSQEERRCCQRCCFSRSYRHGSQSCNHK